MSAPARDTVHGQSSASTTFLNERVFSTSVVRSTAPSGQCLVRAALDGSGVARAEGFKESFAQSDHALALDQDSQGAIDTVRAACSSSLLVRVWALMVGSIFPYTGKRERGGFPGPCRGSSNRKHVGPLAGPTL